MVQDAISTDPVDAELTAKFFPSQVPPSPQAPPIAAPGAPPSDHEDAEMTAKFFPSNQGGGQGVVESTGHPGQMFLKHLVTGTVGAAEPLAQAEYNESAGAVGEPDQADFDADKVQQAGEEAIHAVPKTTAERMAARLGDFIGPNVALGAVMPGGLAARAARAGVDALTGGLQGSADLGAEALGFGPGARAAISFATGAGPSGARSATAAARRLLTPESAGETAAFRDLRDIYGGPGTLDEALDRVPTSDAETGTPYSLGEATGDQNFLNLGRFVSKQDFGKIAAQGLDNKQQKQLVSAIEAAMPGVSDADVQATALQAQNYIESLGPGAPKDEVGEHLRSLVQQRHDELTGIRDSETAHGYTQAEQAAQEHTANLAAQADARARTTVRINPDGTQTVLNPPPENPAAPIDVQPIIDHINDQLATSKKPGDKDSFDKIQQAFLDNETGNVDTTAAGLMKTRSALGALSGDPTMTPFARGVAAQARQMLEAQLGETLPTLNPTNAKFKELSQPINEMEEGPGGYMLARQPGAPNYDNPASSGLKRYQATPEGVQAMVRDAGDPLQARNLLRQQIAYDLNQAGENVRRNAGDGALITAPALRQVFKKYAPLVDQFDRAMPPGTPPIADDLRNIESAQRLADTTVKQQQLQDQLLGRSRTKGVITQGEEAPIRRVSSAAVRRLADNPDELRAAGLNEAQIARVGKVADVLDRLELSNSGSRAGPPGSDTAENLAPGRLKRMVTKKPLGGEHSQSISGVGATVLGEWLGEHFGAPGLGIAAGIGAVATKVQAAKFRDAYNGAVARAIFDPEYAKIGLAKATPLNINRFQRLYDSTRRGLTGANTALMQPAPP